MTAAPSSAKETLRLAKLQSYGILDTLPEQHYDDIAILAAYICQTPTALVSLIDSDRQWFKASVGLNVKETPRSMAFCTHTIQREDVMVIEDTLLHSKFKDNPLVTGEPFIRFYAGAPLITPDGHALGSLCVLDQEPHRLTDKQVHALRVLSQQVVAQIELKYQRDQLILSSQQLEEKVRERTAGLTASLHRLLTAQSTLLKREARSRYGALHDPLTSLPNRSYFLERLEQAVQLSHRQPSHRYAVLFIDIDGFKSINDTLGHDVGDELLVYVAKQIQQLLRKSDLVARLSGDEFAVLLDNLFHQEQAITVTKRLQQRLKVPTTILGQTISVGASIGITFSAHGYRTPEAALKDADIAMYEAKKSAKQRIQVLLKRQLQAQQHPSPILVENELISDNQQFAVFDADMKSTVEAQLTMEEALHKALLDQQFEFHYQPIFNIQTQQLSGFEMLLRWQHPTQGLLDTKTFIEVAEDIGIMQQLCSYTIESACQQMASLRSHHYLLKDDSLSSQAQSKPLTLHINLSLAQIQYPPLIVQWQSALKKYNLPASAFQLEVAEHALLSKDPNIASVLKNLSTIGFGLCINDFGRGQSSLSRLYQLSVRTLKIDHSFVQMLDGSSQEETQARSITKTIVDFGRSAHMDVIATGVETRSQMVALIEIGCQKAQGFWLAQGLPAEAII